MPIHLFEPLKLGPLLLQNRIVVSPMCQYSATGGVATAWHAMHLGHLAASGAGLLTVEATAVTDEGRITPGCLGLWSAESEAALQRLIADLRGWSDMPICVQLAHAGRKASCEVPWNGGEQIAIADGGWQPVAPSPLPYAPRDITPRALTTQDVEALVGAFASAAKRAVRAGANVIQVHAGHGYLLHQFLSPLSNQRDDRYGGSLTNRMRAVLDITRAVKAAVGEGIPVTARVSATDWVPGGWDLEQTRVLARELQAIGCAGIDVSSAGLDPRQTVAVYPGYQVALARAVKKTVDIPVLAVGGINDFAQAEAILAAGDADLIGLARALLYNPRWPWHAAAYFGKEVTAPPPYQRGKPLYSPLVFAQTKR